MSVYNIDKRLTNAKQVRQYLSATVNAFDAEKIDEDHARTIGYLCKVLLSAIEASEFEERLNELEAIVGRDVA
jgi:hypothetical protein